MTRRGSSLDKALEVLDALSRLDEGAAPVSVSQLVEATGLDKSQVSRILATYVDHGYVERVGQRKGYRLGWQSYLVGRRAQVSRLGDLLRAHVEQLGRSLGRSTYFSIRSGVRGVTIASHEPDRRLYLNSWDGRPFSLIGSAVGAVLLSALSDAELHTIHAQASALEGDVEWDAGTLIARVGEARSSAVIRYDNEHAVGISTIAVPLRIGNEPVAGVLSVTEPFPQLADEAADEITRMLRDAAARIEADGAVAAPLDR